MWLALALGCGTGWLDPERVPSAIPALIGDGVVAYAELATAPAPAPAWVTPGPARQDASPLPDLRALSTPERTALTARVCSGVDPAMNERLEAQVALEVATERGTGPWTEEVLERCSSPGPELCRWIDARVRALPEDEPVPPGLFELWHVAGGCLDPGIWDWMPQAGGSLYGQVDYLATQDTQWRPVRDPGIPAEIGRVLVDRGVHGTHTRQALGAFDHPESARLLLQDLAQFPAESQDAVALWLFRQRDPAAVERFERACRANPTAWQCLEGYRPMDDLDAAVDAENTDLTELIDRYPSYREAIRASLLRCATTGAVLGNARGGRCLRALVGSGDEALALAALAKLDRDSIDPSWRSRIEGLVRFEGHEGLRDHLIALELLPEGTEAVDPSDPPVWVADWLTESHRAVVVGSRTPGAVLRELLGQVPELRDAVVVARVAPPEALIGPVPTVELLVWSGGTRYRALASADPVDPAQVAGAANSLARERGLDVRFVVLAPGDLVVWGPEEALRSLARDGLVDPLDPASDSLPADDW